MLNPAILIAMLIALAIAVVGLIDAIRDGLAAYFDSLGGEG